MSGERTEKASPQKKRKAAEKGDRLSSRELIAAAAMLSGVLSLKMFGSDWSVAWRETFRSSMLLAASSVKFGIALAEVENQGRTLVLHCVSVLLFFGTFTVGAALLMGIMQGGGRFNFTALSPNWSRLSPGTNLKNIIGAQSMIRLVKSLVPTTAIAYLAAQRMMQQRIFPRHDLGSMGLLFKDVYQLLLGTAVIMALWSAIDYVNTWRMRESRLKMTKQDVKDEAKESEGSPQIKRRIRQIQRQMRRRQQRANVQKATVVLVNPTHYAVALSFDFVRMEPPVVLAKGMNLIAQQIREEAQWAAGEGIDAHPASLPAARL